MESNDNHKYKRKRSKFGVVIDWETSGCSFDHDNTFTNNISRYQGLAVGIVVFDLKTFEPVESKYIIVQFDPSKYTWDPKAEAVHGLSRDYLKANGVTQDQAAAEFASFMLKYFACDEPICVLGHNVLFDVAFCRQLLMPHGIMFKVDHTIMDTSTVSFLLIGLHKSDDMLHYLGFEQRGAHNAMEDALIELEAVRRFRLIFELGLQS